MRWQHTIATLVLFTLGFGMYARQARAQDDLLTEDEVTIPRIKAYFDAAFFKTTVDSDGDLKIEDGGMKTFVRVDPEKKLISMFSLWGLKSTASEIDKLRFINQLNDDLIVVRFCMPRSSLLWCDYQVKYERGITPFSIVNNYRLFAKVVKGAVTRDDADGIIGSD